MNDTHGHLAGDQVLREVSGVLMGQARLSDVAARYGGEELALLAPEAALGDAVRLAERIRERVAGLRLAGAGGGAYGVTISIGVAQLEAGMAGPEELVAAADRNLYEAKARGRNRVYPAPAAAGTAPAPATGVGGGG